MRDEGAAVAAAANHALGADFAAQAMSRWTILPPHTRSSMAGDLASGKPIELHWPSGRMHSLGLALGISTPGHSVVFRALNMYSAGILRG
ncbi:MAG: ketopantoate reductase C-terminal domain-containing protein [Devosia sp.]